MDNNQISPINSADKESVNRVLKGCQESDYDAVIVIGIKDGLIYTETSSYPDYLRMLGALENAKMEIFNQSGEG